MKKKISVLLLIMLSILFMNSRISAIKKQEISDNKKILVVYFSRTGNTREVAMMIQKITVGDIFEIQPVKKYPDDYEEVKKVAKDELKSGEKPELNSKVSNIKSYDIIFIGYPVWWGTFPAPVRTFLSGHDLSGKIIIPFSTHMGSGLGISVKDIKKLAPDSTIMEGISIWGNDTHNAQDKITQRLRKLDIIN